MTNYTPVTDKYGDLDLRPFAVALAAEMGGEVAPLGYREENSWWSEIILGDVQVNVYRRGPKAIRVTASPAGLRRDIAALIRWPDLAEASMDPTRPLKTLAKDIKRRVIDANEAALATIREKVRAEEERRSRLAGAVERLSVAIPMASIKIASDGASATFYLNSGDAYLSGDLNADGGLWVQRCGSIPADRLAAVVHALTGEADARLSAAASDMLAALKGILESFAECVRTTEALETFPALKAVADAIAKAEGT